MIDVKFEINGRKSGPRNMKDALVGMVIEAAMVRVIFLEQTSISNSAFKAVSSGHNDNPWGMHGDLLH